MRGGKVPKHCPTCNRTSLEASFYGEFCRYCAEDRFRNSLPRRIHVDTCKRCGDIKAKGRFVKPSKLALAEIIQSEFKKCTIKVLDLQANRVIAEVTNREGLSTQMEIELISKKTLCDMCYKKANSYYEGVIQLRGNEEKMARIINSISRYFESNGEFITKIENKDKGYNVYVSNKRLATAYFTIRRISTKMSYTLYGLKNGKQVYRNTYSVRV